MGTGTQSGMGGASPQWAGQMAPTGGMTLPDPMQIAGQYLANERQNFDPIRDQFWATPADERPALRPEFESARDHFHEIRDWFRGLEDMTPGQAKGMAQFGPPAQWDGPKLADPMPVPQFPGMAPHDGTIQGLLAILKQQTAGTVGGGSTGGRTGRTGGGGSGGGFSGPGTGRQDDIGH